jgi:hypothetical protein
MSTLGQYHIDLGTGGTKANRPSNATGRLHYNADSTNKAYETYYDIAAGDGWYAAGGANIVAHTKTGSEWSSLEVTWSKRYLMYDIFMVSTDFTNNNNGLGVRIRNDGSWYNDSRYGMSMTWWCTNDGWDYANHNRNYGSYWNVTQYDNSSYRSQANGETGNLIWMRIGSGLPNNITSNRFTGHGFSSGRSAPGTIGCEWNMSFNSSNSRTASNGQTAYPIDGIRFFTVNGGSIRGASGTGTIVTVYGLSGSEETDV